MKLLLDEVYAPSLGERLCTVGIEAATLVALRLGGRSDAEIFAAAAAGRYVLITENVGDFTRIAAEHSTAGHSHPGLLIALSSRFSRRPVGATALIDAITAIGAEDLDDRVLYLERPDTA